jgi:hypothetical protein
MPSDIEEENKRKVSPERDANDWIRYWRNK